jgi:hypothetical protein
MSAQRDLDNPSPAIRVRSGLEIKSVFDTSLAEKKERALTLPFEWLKTVNPLTPKPHRCREESGMSSSLKLANERQISALALAMRLSPAVHVD